ncbi:hypothetical protein F5X68DRAFT_269514 [Plectosphaerella plurivora]|uniref:Alpha/beta hydrolase fold-3 domain-containing protein n=1 Tax=Plectosphaerella plurivora TaxID=936078 RepID=A0A9P9A784_9PEZI|nr:hypothetical protein F5X68DRAFT_269514 [Plectosphaerella plurivora]
MAEALETATWPSLPVETAFAHCLKPSPADARLTDYSLHRTSLESSSEPLLIHIPAFAPSPSEPPYVPPFLDSLPTAVINYRWPGPYAGDQALELPEEVDADEEMPDFVTPLHWPTPLHDLLFGYNWVLENLAPSSGRRDIYVHGAYLGATLAASLALTECHRHERFAVRGLAAYNGIYNWTMFLPDHKINKPTTGRKATPSLPPAAIEGTPLHTLRGEMSTLFKGPSDLFDPFASPSLLFQTAGLLVPQSFQQASGISAMVDRMAALGLDGSAADLMPTVMTPPRRSALSFPPRRSTLTIPETLLLHDTATVPAAARKTKAKTTVTSRTAARRKLKGNHFAAQAEELGGLMRRSLEKIELKERMKWDEEFEDVQAEVEARVKIVDAGEPVEGQLQMNDFGEDVVRRWLEGQMSRSSGS